MRPFLRAAATVAIAAVLPFLIGCEKTSASPQQEAAIKKAVDGYLHALAEAYSTLNVNVLEGHASPNEILAVKSLLRDLASTGDRLDASLRTYDIERLAVFREVNASVKLIEVWDVVRYDITTGAVKGRTPDSIQYTLLQLRRVKGTWLVVGRSVLKRETPTVVPEGEAE